MTPPTPADLAVDLEATLRIITEEIRFPSVQRLLAAACRRARWAEAQLLARESAEERLSDLAAVLHACGFVVDVEAGTVRGHGVRYEAGMEEG